MIRPIRVPFGSRITIVRRSFSVLADSNDVDGKQTAGKYDGISAFWKTQTARYNDVCM